jgi:hypothetical protein
MNKTDASNMSTTQILINTLSINTIIKKLLTFSTQLIDLDIYF